MHIGDFDLYRDLLKETSGLVITQDKSYLLDSRLMPVAKKWNYETLEAMTLSLRGVPEPDLIKDVVESMTTNETSFFRDMKPFDILKETVFPYLSSNRAKNHKIRIWCAACSSGQEPYSVAMMINEQNALLGNRKFEILATDISGNILNRAKKATYSQFEVQRGMPMQMLIKYFEQDNESWRVKDEIVDSVEFQKANLLHDFADFGTFDIIFCRNVLIYLDDDDKKDILTRLAQRLPQDGFLFLGGAETVLNFSDALKPHTGHRGLYVLKEGSYADSESNQAIA